MTRGVLVAVGLAGALSIGASSCGNAATAGAQPTVIPASNFVLIAPSTSTKALTASANGATGLANDKNARFTYRVQTGEGLYAIASKTGVTAQAIVVANGWTDGLKHTLHAGQLIYIPGNGHLPKTTKAATKSATPAGGTTVRPMCRGKYKIKAGDRKDKVAKAHNISVSRMDAANAGNSYYTKWIAGATIIIPTC